MRRASSLSSPVAVPLFVAVSVCQHEGIQRQEVHNSSKVYVHTLSQTRPRAPFFCVHMQCCAVCCSAAHEACPVAAVPIPPFLPQN